MLRAVTFDYWNTLVRADTAGVRDRRLTAWLGLLAGEGIDLDAPVVEAGLAHAASEQDRHWRAGKLYGPADAVAAILARLGLEVSPSVEADLLRSITHPDPAHDPPLTPNVVDAIDELRAGGVRIGIVCDVGLTPSPALRRVLERHGVLDRFDHWSFSDEVGCFKPDPTIFRHALDGLGGIDPAEAVHVGDLRRTDVAGARGMGMVAVRYRGIADDPGSVEAGTDDVEGDLVVADHADLVAGLARLFAA